MWPASESYDIRGPGYDEEGQVLDLGPRVRRRQQGFSFSLLCDGQTVDVAEGLSICELSFAVDGHSVRVDLATGARALASVFRDGEFLRTFR